MIGDEASEVSQMTTVPASDNGVRALSLLMDGLRKEPDVLRDKNVGFEIRGAAIPTIIEGVVAEIARQHYGLCVYACAAWVEDGKTLVTTESMQLPDPDPERTQQVFTPSHHFAHYCRRYAGLSAIIPPEDAFPMVWPDPMMGGRPCLPPGWDVNQDSKRTLVDWMNKLWRWQGGLEPLDWSRVIDDINNRTGELIELKRLPPQYTSKDAAHILPHPDAWDEKTILIWSSHLGSSLDYWGRVLPHMTDTALQFRLVEQSPGESQIICEQFVTEPRNAKPIQWSVPELLYGKRLMRSMNEGARDHVHALYGQADRLVEMTTKDVPGLQALLEKLRKYEALPPPQADEISDVQAQELGWHPACQRVSRNLDSFSSNCDPSLNEFPPAFSSRIVTGHWKWDVTGFRDWLARRPFWDKDLNTMLGGRSGIAVAFYGIAHFALNIASAIPKYRRVLESNEDSDMSHFSRADFRILEQCVSLIEEQLGECSFLNPVGKMQAVTTDRERRYDTWTPQHWVIRYADGRENVISEDAITRSPYNTFMEPWSEFVDASATSRSDDTSIGEEERFRSDAQMQEATPTASMLAGDDNLCPSEAQVGLNSAHPDGSPPGATAPTMTRLHSAVTSGDTEMRDAIVHSVPNGHAYTSPVSNEKSTGVAANGPPAIQTRSTGHGRRVARVDKLLNYHKIMPSTGSRSNGTRLNSTSQPASTAPATNGAKEHLSEKKRRQQNSLESSTTEPNKKPR